MNWKREIAKGCFGGSKGQKKSREHGKKVLTNVRRSLRNAYTKNNTTIVRKRQAQITMMSRSLYTKQSIPFHTQKRG